MSYPTRPCSRCFAPIVWAITQASKRQPLDAAPDPAGNVAAYRDVADNWRARSLRDGEEPLRYERRMMPHHATCSPPPPPAPRLVQPSAPPAARPPCPPGTPDRGSLPPNVVPISAARRRGNTRKHPLKGTT